MCYIHYNGIIARNARIARIARTATSKKVISIESLLKSSISFCSFLIEKAHHIIRRVLHEPYDHKY